MHMHQYAQAPTYHRHECGRVAGAGAWGVRGGEQDGDLEPAATAPDRSRAARAEDGRAEVLPQLVRCPDAPDPEHTPGRSGKDARSEEGSGPSQAEHVSSAPSAGHPQQAQQQTRQQQQPQHQQHQQPQHQHQQHQQHHQQQQQPAQQKGRGRDPGWDFDVEGGGSWWLDRSELLANSLTHLALVVDGLNSKDHGFELALFAGGLRACALCVHICMSMRMCAHMCVCVRVHVSARACACIHVCVTDLFEREDGAEKCAAPHMILTDQTWSPCMMLHMVRSKSNNGPI